MQTSSTATGREALLGNPVAGSQDQPADPMVHASVAAAQRSLAQLQQTQQVAADTERLGMTIMGQLSDQRGQLVDAIERREEAHQTLTVSSRLIRQMHRRATWIKISLCLIITGLMAGIMVIIYLRYLAPDDHSPSPSHRMLQGASPPPPPPPNPLPVAVASRPFGAGVIILTVLGIVSCFACIYAYPRGIVVRTLVTAATTVLYAAIALTLLLMPRDDAPADEDSTGAPTDASTIWRVVLLSSCVLSCLLGLVCVLTTHLMAPQRPPAVKDFAEGDVEVSRVRA